MMSSKQTVLDKINPTSTYIGTAVKKFVDEVTHDIDNAPDSFKKGDVIKLQTVGSNKNRPSVIIKVCSEYVVSIPLTTTESVHCLSESKSRFFKNGFFSNTYAVTPIKVAKENFIGVYDNHKLLNLAIKELRVFIVKNI